MRYQSYKGLYKQDFTLPIKFLDDIDINFGSVMVFPILFLFNTLVTFLLSLGGMIPFVISRFWVILILTCLEMYALLKVPTAGKPLIVWLFYVPYFIFRVPKTTRAFVPVKLQKTWKPIWKIPFRPVTERKEGETEYAILPLQGQAKKFAGLTFKTRGATRFTFHPISRQVNIEVGTFEKLQEKKTVLNRLRPTTLEVGRGEVRLLHQAGETKVEYVPNIGGEEESNGASS